MNSCVICNTSLVGDYMHRATCKHHQCFGCAVPMIRAGKTFCPRCPIPELGNERLEGNLVLGYDNKQNQLVADELRAERDKVRPKGAR